MCKSSVARWLQARSCQLCLPLLKAGKRHTWDFFLPVPTSCLRAVMCSPQLPCSQSTRVPGQEGQLGWSSLGTVRPFKSRWPGHHGVAAPQPWRHPYSHSLALVPLSPFLELQSWSQRQPEPLSCHETSNSVPKLPPPFQTSISVPALGSGGYRQDQVFGSAGGHPARRSKI